MTTPASDRSKGSTHMFDLEVASAPAAMTGGLHNTHREPVPQRVSHDSRLHDDAASLATMNTFTSTGTKGTNGGSFLHMMQNFLQGAKSFDSQDNNKSEAMSPMRGPLFTIPGQRDTTLDSVASKEDDDFSDEEKKDNFSMGNSQGGPPADWESIISGVDPSLCSTPPRTRIDPEQSGSLQPPGKSPQSPPDIHNTAGFNSFFRRPLPPGPESSDDELKESLVMENQTQGWFGGLLTPDRLKHRETDETLPETPPSINKDDFTPVSSVESRGGEEEEDDEDLDGSGCKVVSEKGRVKVRLIYFVMLFFFLLIIIGGLAYFLWYLSKLDKEHHDQTREFVATMRPSTLGTMEPTMEPSTSTPTISANPTITAYPTGNPTRRPTPVPTKRPTRPPTGQPSKNPTQYPTLETPLVDFMGIMANVAPEVAMKMESPGTPHHTAYNWLAEDPNYYTYSDERKINRFVLALIKLQFTIQPETDSPSARPTTSPSMIPTVLPNVEKPSPYFWDFTKTAGHDGGDERRLNWYALESWMQYTDECQWFSSYWFNRVACTANYQFKRLYLINVGLEGTIPTEIALLSKLDAIHLPLNKLTGTIPTEFGSLRWLNSFNVSYNGLEGTIPKEIANGYSMAYLDVGNNNFTAPVPYEVCKKGLRTFRGDCAEIQCTCCTSCARNP